MNYESYGYINANYYNKTDDSQVRIPWWYWELPFDGDDSLFELGLAEPLSTISGFAFAGKLFCVIYSSTEKTLYLCTFNKNVKTDIIGQKGIEAPINSTFTTKIFDFGTPHYRKDVSLVNMAFGNNGGTPIRISFIADNSEEHGENIFIDESNNDEYSIEFIHNRQVRPCVRHVGRFGIKVECEGSLSLASISLNYKIIGGIK